MAAATALSRTHFSQVDFPSSEASTSSSQRGTKKHNIIPEAPSRPPRRSSRGALSTKIAVPSIKASSRHESPKVQSKLSQPTSPAETATAQGVEQAVAASSTREQPPASPSRSKPKNSVSQQPLSGRGGEMSRLHMMPQASLSTPELHLASDPLLDIHDSERRQRLQDQQSSDRLFLKRPRASSRALESSKLDKLDHTAGLQRPFLGSSGSRGRSPLPLSGQEAYTSLGAVLGTGRDDRQSFDGERATPVLERRDRDRKDSAETTIIRSPENSSTDAEASTVPFNPSASKNWFTRRTRRWSSTQRGIRSSQGRSTEDPAKPVGSASDKFNNDQLSHRPSSMAPPRPSISSSLCDSISDLSTGPDNSSMFFSDSGIISSFSHTTAATDTSQNSLDPNAIILERLRSARAYMVEELTKLSSPEMGQDQERIASLASRSRERDAERNGTELDASKEMLEFWHSISSGVLLCLLVNCLMPNAIDRIDRRNLDWVKADNISRFLRALRDFFNVRTKDLFHPLDLADATIEGLDRAVHTILVVQRSARTLGMSVRSPSSPVTPAVAEKAHSKRRSLIASLPQTPETLAFDLPASATDDQVWSPAGSPSKSNISLTLKAAQSMTIQQHRQAAEAKLVRNSTAAPSLTMDPQIRATRRRSSENGGQSTSASRSKGPSITFAEGSFLSRSSLDEEAGPSSASATTASTHSGRMPYRDRKMSESAISLTGVAEEEVEDTTTGDTPPHRAHAGDMEVVRDQPTHDTTTPIASRSRPISVMRSNSQRRISQEIGFGTSPQSIRGSLDIGQPNDELRLPSLNGPSSGVVSVSPARQTPVRRHSARATSVLNPARDSPVAPNKSSTDNPPILGRVPFPRSYSNSESPALKRLSVGLNGIDSLTATPTGNRPIYRHLRYSSELHLPSVTPNKSDDAFEASGPTTPSPIHGHSDKSDMLATPRPRFDSEIGSLYSSSATNLLSQEDVSAPPARVGREPSLNPGSRHKLILTANGKDVTYQMGNCIGRGQFGSVYRALNLNSGQMVAVKRIKLEGRSEDEVTQLMNEVDLLKSLTHPSVVKYEGLVRGPDVVSIILEYVENGSLLHTLKAFGNFPEKLVASYAVKILEGLDYLHEKDVVHCDLKAANILTTKNGNVKLSDFGVSLNLKAMEKVQTNDAIGTPNWMAPEVIELKGASTAADIWSLGCTIIELLTGKPPYGDMLAMSALFRIVEDERPPIPDKCSQSLRHFLIQCFDKDPTKRPTAAQLFEHDWLKEMWTGHKELRPQDSVPFLRRISLDHRRVDVKTLHAAINEIAEPTDARVVTDALTRPKYDNLRSFSTPAGEGWSSSMSAEDTSGSPSRDTTSPSADPFSLVHSPEVAVATDNGVAATNESLASNPSVLDLAASAGWRHDASQASGDQSEGQLRGHSFVKSTFSKAVRCRICRDSVRKHAVLCEECGLICHASCAREATAPCDIQTQMLLLRQAEPILGRGASPAGSVSSTHLSGLGVAMPPNAVSILPINFKFPFSRSRRQSKTKEGAVVAESTAESGRADDSAKADTSPKTSPFPLAPVPKEKNEATERSGRRRRISLLPTGVLRTRSPSPPPVPQRPLEPTYRVDSGHESTASAIRSGAKEARRASSTSYGSMSGSSSLSSSSQAGMGVATSPEPIGGKHKHARPSYFNRAVSHQQAARRRDHRPTQSLAAFSSEHLGINDGPAHHRYGRISSDIVRKTGVHSGSAKGNDVAFPGQFRTEATAIGQSQMMAAHTAAAVASPAEATPFDKRRSRRTSFGPTRSKSKEDCVIM